MGNIGTNSLKAFFETGDKPTQAQYRDQIDTLSQMLFENTRAYISGEAVIIDNSGFKVYLCNTDTAAGESPITTPAKWDLASGGAGGGSISRDNVFSQALDFTLADFTHYLRGVQSGAFTFTIGTPAAASYKLVETEFNTDGSAINLPGISDGLIELKNEYASDNGIYGLSVKWDGDNYLSQLYLIKTFSPSVTNQYSGLVTGPSGIAVDDVNGFVYVSESGSTTIRKISLTTFLQVGTLTMPANGRLLTIDSANGRLFATCVGNTNVYEIAISTFTISNTRAVAGFTDTLSIYVNPSDGKFYVSDLSAPFHINEYSDYTLGSLLQAITTVGEEVDQMQVVGTDLWCVSPTSSAIKKVDLGTQVVTTVKTGQTTARGMYVDEQNIIYVGMNIAGNNILIYNLTTDTLISTLAVNATTQIRNIAHDANSRRYLISNQNTNEIIEITY